ncbi:MAG: cytochrome c [Gammaproteobacteria bacterium]|nr:cytochrome c [Gammaproteobacteria bacterium]
MKTLLTASIAVIASLSFNVSAADIAAGKAKAATCAACHGANGISAIPMYPNLAGQKAEYMVKQLKAFKSGERKDPVMTAMAMPLSEEDMINVSAYFASLK